MNAPLESALTTVVAMVVGGAITHFGGNLVAEPDRATLTQALTTIVLAAGGGALTWWKARQRTQAAMLKQVSPRAMIKEINTVDNGLKVVPEGATATRVDRPLRGPGS